ncbi:MAG: hypothetical protein GC158_09485 [Cyanobacteria bacterium RI_101]|nr:hypothetical protein [Cyanobacteria bacterium RI_101]
MTGTLLETWPGASPELLTLLTLGEHWRRELRRTLTPFFPQLTELNLSLIPRVGAEDWFYHSPLPRQLGAALPVTALPERLKLTPSLDLPLTLESKDGEWLRWRLSHRELTPWWRAVIPELESLPPPPEKIGLTAPLPWGSYQYVHVQLWRWRENRPRNGPEPETWSLIPSEQALWRSELALLDALTQPRPESRPWIHLTEALANGALMLLSQQATLEPVSLRRRGLLDLAQWLLWGLLKNQGLTDAPTAL